MPVRFCGNRQSYYAGDDYGGTTVDKTSANIIDMTTIGTNSYNKGMMATIVGAYSINTGDFDGSGGFNSLSYGSQNMGSVLIGSLNQNRSKGNGGYSGIANTMVGVATLQKTRMGHSFTGRETRLRIPIVTSTLVEILALIRQTTCWINLPLR